MRCKIGDRVRFLNDVGGGKITRIEKNTVYVLGDDGFEIPMMISEVIVVDQSTDSTINKQFSEEKERPSLSSTKPRVNDELSEQRNSKLTKEAFMSDLDYAEIDFTSTIGNEKDPEGDLVGLFLAFVPVNQSNIVESNQELYIINDSPYRTFYSISKWDGEMVLPLRAGFLYPDSKELVKVFNRESLNADIILNIQTLFFKNIKFTPQQPDFYDLRINPTKFYRAGSFSDNDFFEEKALVFSIADSKKEEILKTLTNKAISTSIKEKDLTPIKPDTSKQPEVEEVDLHIEELVDNPKEFTAGQILEIQMARFKVTIEGAIKGKTRKMVFIHGVGNGKLKHEILKELGKSYPKLRYQDASFREYGYGATMVFFRG